MRKTSTIVIFLHCLVLLWMGLGSLQQKETKKTRLVVKTVAPKPLQPTIAKAPAPRAMPAATQPRPPSPSAPVPSLPTAKAPVAITPKSTAAVPASPSKKPAPPSKGVQTRMPEKKPVKKESPSVAPETVALIQQLEQSLAKIEKSSSKPSQTYSTHPIESLPPLFKISPLLTEAGEEGDAGYESELVALLYQQLHLPEFGEVKMKLTLQNNGAFVKMQVIRAQSSRNRQYLEEQLPKLHMPRFIGALANKREETFILTFCNE